MHLKKYTYLYLTFILKLYLSFKENVAELPKMPIQISKIGNNVYFNINFVCF